MFKHFATLACITLAIYFGVLQCARLIIPERNPLLDNAERTNNELNMGLSELINCNYFRTTYPLYRKRVLAIKSILFEYDNTDKYYHFFAVSIVKESRIILTPHFFNLKYSWTRQSVLAHETLHFAGMPRHKVPSPQGIARKNDPIYKTIAMCFPNTVE